MSYLFKILFSVIIGFLVVTVVAAKGFPFGADENAVGKSEIEGLVLDAKTRKPIVGVNIYMPELKQGAVTDVNGRFSLKLSTNSTNVLLQFSFVGYQNKLIRIKPENWQSGNVVLLEEERLVVNEVIVSAGRIASRDEIPVLVEKIGIKEMRTDGAINTMTSISKIPGVEQIAYGIGVGKPVIRGLSFSRILSMYQGTRFENQQWGADHGLGVNDLGIEAIEIIKGPASFLYGSGAVGGVVYMVDERPAPKGKMHAELNSTFHSNTLGLRQTVGVKETRESGWFYGLHAAYETHADYTDGSGRTIGNSRFNTQTFRANTGLNKDWGMLKVSYTYHNQNLGIIADDELDNTMATSRNDRGMQLPYQNIQDHLLTLGTVWQLGEGRLEATLGHHYNFRKEIESAYDLVDLGLTQTNTTFDAKYFLEDENAEHIFGVQGFNLRNSNMNNVEEILIPDAEFWDASVYYLYTLRKNKTTYQGGLRYDARSTKADASAGIIRKHGYKLPGLPLDQQQVSLAHTGLSGSVGLIHRFNQQIHVRSNLSSGFRAPDMAELFSNGQHAGTQRFERGNINFEREQNFQLDFAGQYQNPYFSMEASPFVNLISNYVYLSPTGEAVQGTDLAIWTFEQGNAILYGGELQSRVQPLGNKQLEVDLGYSLVRGRNPDSGKYMPLMPADRLNSSVSWNWTDLSFFENLRVKMSYTYSWEQDRLSLREQLAYQNEVTPSFSLLGFSVGGSFALGAQQVNLDLAVNNLLNTAYVDHLSFLRPVNINNIGRNIMLNLNLPIIIK